MQKSRLVVNESLWVCGGITNQAIQYPRYEMAALRDRGARTFVLNGDKDTKGLAELDQILRKSDVHVVLFWLRPREVKALRPILQKRKNYSVVLEDWWMYPWWFTRGADYVINRMYSGIAVRSGQTAMVTEPPPVLLWPDDNPSTYGTLAAVLRLPVLATWPLVDACKWAQRRNDDIRPERMLYLPFTVVADSLPLGDGQKKYDFTLTGSTVAIWPMRDPYASFKHTFANLYYDRKRLMDLIRQFDGKPYTVYDWRKMSPAIPPQAWDDYIRITRESRFVLTTGGLHNSGLPKHLEYACLGSPMIGRQTLFEFPWLEECMIDVGDLNLSADSMKSVLEHAMDRYASLRENCLKWREQLFKLHEAHRLFDVLQSQADGRGIPPGYIKEMKTNRAGNGSMA